MKPEVLRITSAPYDVLPRSTFGVPRRTQTKTLGYVFFVLGSSTFTSPRVPQIPVLQAPRSIGHPPSDGLPGPRSPAHSTWYLTCPNADDPSHQSITLHPVGLASVLCQLRDGRVILGAAEATLRSVATANDSESPEYFGSRNIHPVWARHSYVGSMKKQPEPAIQPWASSITTTSSFSVIPSQHGFTLQQR